jgi:hypothetical protein
MLTNLFELFYSFSILLLSSAILMLTNKQNIGIITMGIAVGTLFNITVLNYISPT